MLTTMVVALIVSSSIALAAVKVGTQANDTLRGTQRADEIYGLNGKDRLYGLDNSDELYGGVGQDRIYGQSGGDELYGGSGTDFMFGGDGSDFINSADRGTSDVVNCGGADRDVDRVVADEQDGVDGCMGQDVVSRR